MGRKGNVKWILFVLLFIAMLGCTNKESYLSGVWRSEKAESKWYTLDFMSDHTGVFECHKTNESFNTVTNFRWTLLEDGRVKIEDTEDASTKPLICKSENDKLVCKAPGKHIVAFTKERN